MCFCTKKLVLKQAKRDKVFYKVLEQVKVFSISNNVFIKYITPYRDMEVKLGKWYTSNSAIVDLSDSDIIALGEGVFHLFKNRKSAESLVKRSYKYIIVKAIVPKGAFYATNNNEVITSDVRYEKLAPKKTFKFWKR